MFSTNADSIPFSVTYDKYKKDFLWACSFNDIHDIKCLFSFISKEDILAGLRSTVISNSIDAFNFIFKNTINISKEDIYFIYRTSVIEHNIEILKILLNDIHLHQHDINFHVIIMYYTSQIRSYNNITPAKEKNINLIKFLLNYNIVLHDVLVHINEQTYYSPVLKSIIKEKLNIKSNKELRQYLKIL